MSSSKSAPTLTNTSWRFEAIGTSWQIDMTVEQRFLPSLKKQISARIEAFDKNYSRFRADSLVTAISRQAGTYALPGDAGELLRIYDKLFWLSVGVVEALIGKALEGAG